MHMDGLLLRLIPALLLLGYASLLDWRRREIDDPSWQGLAALGVLFGIHDLLRYGTPYLAQLALSLGVTALLVLPMHHLRLMGGGDAKILLALALLFPYYPQPVTTLFPVFTLSVFVNAVTLTLLLPLLFFIINLRHLREVRSLSELYALFLGYRRKASEVRHYEAVYGRGRSFRFLLTTDAELGRAEGDDEVWVTPAVPFVIPITAGVLLSAVYGDIVSMVILSIM